MGDVPSGGFIHPPKAIAVVEASGDNPINVASQGYPKGSGVDDSGNYPKDNTYTQEIGMLKLLWKVVEAIIDTPMRESVRLHDILHGFRAGRGNETRIFGVKLVQ